jgi:DNA-binding NtrC family response regulator
MPIALIITDDPGMRPPITGTIRCHGWTPLTARNGYETVAMADRDCPDLIIADCTSMEDAELLDALLVIRMSEPGLPLLVLLGKGPCAAVERMIGEPCLAVHTPITPEELLDALYYLTARILVST